MIDKTKPYGFQCVPKDLMTMSQKFIENDLLCNLLYRTEKNALLEKPLTTDEKEKLLSEEYIQILPQVKVDEENKVQNYIVITFGKLERSENPMYLSGLLTIDILCNINNWKIINRYQEVTLRPYEIADKIMNLIDEKKFSGIGTMNFISSDPITLATNTDYCGLTLMFEFVNSRFN